MGEFPTSSPSAATTQATPYPPYTADQIAATAQATWTAKQPTIVLAFQPTTTRDPNRVLRASDITMLRAYRLKPMGANIGLCMGDVYKVISADNSGLTPNIDDVNTMKGICTLGLAGWSAQLPPTQLADLTVVSGYETTLKAVIIDGMQDDEKALLSTDIHAADVAGAALEATANAQATGVAQQTAVPVPPAVQACILADFNSSLLSCIKSDSKVPLTSGKSTYIAWRAGVVELDFQTKDGAGNWFTQASATNLATGPNADTLTSVEVATGAFFPGQCNVAMQITALDINDNVLGHTQVTTTC